jgi:hypothetical protein
VQASPTVVQTWQAAPSTPQCCRIDAMQAVPVQQPAGQLAAVQAHLPDTHCWPAAHTAPVPHSQVPVDEHVSPVSPQSWHAPPPVPQNDGVCRHAVPLQQPPGHDAASHVHSPWTQCWPEPQAGPDPHAHAPVALQLSVVIVAHPTHCEPAPARPQWANDGVVQAVPLQQPPGQDAAVQTQAPSTHCWPAAHVWPSAPHTHSPYWLHVSAVRSHDWQEAQPQFASERARHSSPWQQPCGHVVTSQTHWPASQRCPVAHGGPRPHWQRPSAQVSDPAPHDEQAPAPVPQ